MFRFRRSALGVLVALALSSLRPGPAEAQMGGGGMPMNDTPDSMSGEIFLPTGVQTDGSSETFLQTDLWIRCQTVPTTATFYFHAADATSASPAATAAVTLTQPVTYFANVVSTLFGLGNATGNIRIDPSHPVSAVGRVYNDASGSTFSLAMMVMSGTMSSRTVMPMGGPSGMNNAAMYLLGLLPEPGHRVSVAVMNTGPAPVSGHVEILDADGTKPTGSGPVTLPFTIQGYSSHQFNDVLVGVHSKSGSDSTLQILVPMNQGSSGMIMAYALVSDNMSNDSYVVMGNMMNGGSGMGGGMGGGMIRGMTVDR